MRCFIALPVPEETAEEIDAVQEGLRGADWTPEENLHLTLVFLGEQDRRTLADLDSALQAIAAPAFPITLQGVGAFGAAKDKRLAFATVAENPALRHLQAKVETAVRSAGIAVESRRFTPHVTLARWRRGAVSEEALRDYLAANNLFRAAPFAADRIILYRSDLSRGGALYTPLAEYPLR